MFDPAQLFTPRPPVGRLADGTHWSQQEEPTVPRKSHAPYLTVHTDYTLSIRLRQHGDGTDTPSMDDIVASLQQAALSMRHMAATCREGRGRFGDTAASAPGYDRLADRYEALSKDINAARSSF